MHRGFEPRPVAREGPEGAIYSRVVLVAESICINNRWQSARGFQPRRAVRPSGLLRTALEGLTSTRRWCVTPRGLPRETTFPGHRGFRALVVPFTAPNHPASGEGERWAFPVHFTSDLGSVIPEASWRYYPARRGLPIVRLGSPVRVSLLTRGLVGWLFNT